MEKSFRRICKMVQNIRRKSFAYLNLDSNIGRNMHSWLPMKCRSLKALFEWLLLKKLFREDNKWKWQTSIYINNCLIEVKMQKCITATFYFFYLIFLIYILIIKLNWARPIIQRMCINTYHDNITINLITAYLLVDQFSQNLALSSC